jgi:hypothetical protein
MFNPASLLCDLRVLRALCVNSDLFLLEPESAKLSWSR